MQVLTNQNLCKKLLQDLKRVEEMLSSEDHRQCSFYCFIKVERGYFIVCAKKGVGVADLTAFNFARAIGSCDVTHDVMHLSGKPEQNGEL